MKTASLETKTFGEVGSEALNRLNSLPERPSMSGRVCLSQPRTWSKERFSMTRTTRVLMGDLISWVGFLGNGNCWEGHNRKRTVRTVKWGRRRTIPFYFFPAREGFFVRLKICCCVVGQLYGGRKLDFISYMTCENETEQRYIPGQIIPSRYTVLGASKCT